MANPAPIISQINAFNATEGTIISFNIVGGTSIVRSNIIYIYDLSDNSLVCTHLYISTESIHELPANTDPSIAYASGKSSADFTNGKQYYAQIQTFTNTAGTEGASGASIAKLFWCLVDPTLTINTIPSSISTTSYNVGAVYNSNTTATSNIVQQYQFNLYSATGVLVQSSGVITGSGAQQGTSTAYDLFYNFTGLSVGSSYYVTVEVTTTQGMTVSTQSSTFTVSIDTPTLGEATVVNNACDGYISVTSNLSGEYGGSASGSIVTFETDSVNEVTSLTATIEPIQDLHGYDHPWVGGAGKNLLDDSKKQISENQIAIGYSDVNPWTNGVSTHLKAGTYTFSIETADGTNPTALYVGYSGEVGQKFTGYSNKLTFTLTEEKDIYVWAYKSGYQDVGVSAITHAQLELGSTATAWTPYSNICPISGWDSVSATVAGKNLFDKSLPLVNGYLISATGEITANPSYQYSEYYTRVLPDTTYAFSGKIVIASIYNSVAFYDKHKNFISRYLPTFGGVPSVFTTPSNCEYIRFNTINSANIDKDTIQLELGSTATAYEPYQGTTHTATFEETVYGGDYDFVGGSGQSEMASVDLSTLGFTYNTGWKCWTGLIAGSKAPSNNNTPVNAVSDRLTAVNASGYTSRHDAGTVACNVNGRWFIDNGSTSELTGQLVYELAEPRTIQLAPQTIATLEGVNNVWGDSGDVSVTYNIPITNLLVKRQDTADISGKWLTLYSQPITQASDMDFTFIDFLNQYGKTYKYALVPLLTQEQSGVEVEVEGGYTVSDEVVSIFDGVFVADNTAIYKLKAGVNYGDLSKVQEVGSINTIGSKYPIIVSNSKVDYRTASLSATIVADDYYDNGNLNRMDMVQKRELMESFFTNKRAKILKDWNGNIWLVVFIDNINITFINEYGMGIATLTATWTEIGDVTSEEDLQNTRIINVG